LQADPTPQCPLGIQVTKVLRSFNGASHFH